MIDVKKIILILFPVVVSSSIYPLFLTTYLIQPTIAGYDIVQMMKLTNYIILPVFFLIYGLILLLKYKPSISKKLAIGLVAFSLFYISVFTSSLVRFTTPSLFIVTVEEVSAKEASVEFLGILRNFIIFNTLYVSEIIGLFVSQFFEKTYLKVIIFLILSFGITGIIFTPLISIIF